MDSTLRSSGLEAAVCPSDRHLVEVAPGLPCDDYGPWQGQRLFAEATPYLASSGVAPLGPLARVCRYQWQGSSPPSDHEVAMLYDMPGAVPGAAGPDCEVAFEESDNSVMTDAGDQTMAQMFLAGVGALDAQALGLPANDALRVPVVVAVVDTVPEATEQPRSRHGESVGSIVESITCPGPGPCAVTTLHAIGLPRWSGGVDYTLGGYYGSHGDLAAGIHEAVERWRALSALSPSPPRLIVNLSVGWNPHVLGTTDDVGEATVKLAIEEARCSGALVIAAAGNRDGLGDLGPTLPGGWEEESAPTVARCIALTGAPPSSDLSHGYGPLVFAAGGLDLRGDALPKGRVGGRPRLAAAADHATVGAGVDYTPPMTGTSVAAAAVTGAAALVWSFRGDLAPNAVMSVLYDASNPVSSEDLADFSLGGVSSGIHQVDACLALESACVLPGSVCPQLDFSGCVDPGPSVAELFEDFDGLPATEAVVSFASSPIVCEEGERSRELHTAGSEVRVCADSLVDPLAKFVTPQPGTHICDSCTMELTSTSAHVDASLNRVFAGATIESFVIDVYLADGRQLTFDFGRSVSLSPNTKTRVQLRSLTAADSVIRATVTTKLAKRQPSTDALIIR